MKKLLEELNVQFNYEIESAYVYRAMAADAKDKGMDGMSHFLSLQAAEEMEHAEAFYNFIFEMDEKPIYAEVPAPKADYGSFLEMFKDALDHERSVTKRIKDIYRLAQEEGCLDTQQFLNQFIEEQREEENTFRGIVEQLERIDGNWNGLYSIDRKLGQRQ